MSRELDAVLDAIPRLAESERTALALVLVDWLGDGSTPDELDEAWRAEIARREEEIRTGTAELVPWEEVEAELHSALDARRDARRKRFDRITFDPDVLNGQPCIRGVRLSVARVLEALATHGDIARVRVEYPEIEMDDITQALSYAASVLVDHPDG